MNIHPKTRNEALSVEQLNQIWRQVLKTPRLDPDDDFFQLGGDTAKALCLLDMVEAHLGLRVPITAFPHMLTVARMAAFFDAPLPEAPISVIKAGAVGHPAVFLTHGSGGSVLEAYPVGRRIRWPGIVYGIQTGTLNSMGTRTRIEDMGRGAGDAILQQQPRGPYYLVGISAGGLVMLETALYLLEHDQEVGLLAFLDTYPHPNLWPIRCRIDDTLRRIKRHTLVLAELGPKRSIPHILSLCRNRVGRLHWRLDRRIRIDVNSRLPGSELKQLQHRYMAAMAQYAPHPFPGTVRFLRAAVHTSFPSDPAAVWGSIGQPLLVEPLACEHVQMVTTRADETANWLSRCLESV